MLKKKLFIHHLMVIPSTIPSIKSLSWCVCNLSSMFQQNLSSITHTIASAIPRIISLFMMWMYIYLSCFKKKIVHSSPYKVRFKSNTSLWKCGCDLLSMFLKKQFIHHLTKCHSKVLYHFENADVIYYPCFKK